MSRRTLASLRWAAALVPAALGLLALAVLSLLGDPILVLRANLGLLAALAGLGLSTLLAGGLAIHTRGEGRHLREIARERARAASERRRLLGRLDHELKNPLTAIHAGVANLAAAPLEPWRQQTLGAVAAQTTRLSRLATDLRKLAELETRPLEWTPTDLAELLAESLELARERP